MAVFARIPESVRRAAKAVLPDSVAESLRSMNMRRYDLSLVVARETPFRAWLNRHVLHLYYPPSLVTRETRGERARSIARGEKPLLQHFDIHITDHCNLNCKGCGHFSNLHKANLVDVDAFDADMAAIAEKLRVAQIFLLGGEPLLHPRVASIVRIARSHFPETRIVVVTNGVLVTKMHDEFWDAMSDTRTVLMCDSYPIGLPVEQIDALAARHEVTVEWTDARDLFFKVPLDLEGTQDPADSFRRCDGINNCPMYKDGRLYPCAYASYIDAFKERFRIEGQLEVCDSDSIDVREADGVEIMEFMTRAIPFCRHCDFDHFEMYEWGRTERCMDEWTRSR